MLDGFVLGRRVVLGDDDHRGGERESNQRAQPHGHRVRAHDFLGYEVECGGGNDARYDHAFVERVHDLAAFLGRDEIGADDRGYDGNGAEQQREDHRIRAHVAHQQPAEEHGGDQRNRVGFKQVGGHAGAIAHIVADVVGDHCGVARVILRNSRLDFADEIRADIRTLGEYSAAQTRKYRNQGTAEGQSDERAQRGFAVAEQPQHGEVVAGHPEDAEAHHQHPGDRAASERHFERGVDSQMSRLRGAHVGAHRDVHADIPRKTREDRAHGEPAGTRPTEPQSKRHEEDDSHDGNGAVLAIEVGAGAGLDCRRDLLHPGIACRLRQDPAHRDGAVSNRNESCSDGQK